MKKVIISFITHLGIMLWKKKHQLKLIPVMHNVMVAFATIWWLPVLMWLPLTLGYKNEYREPPSFPQLLKEL